MGLGYDDMIYCCLAWGSVAWVLGGMDWIGWMDARIRLGAFQGESRWGPLGGFSRRCFYRRSIYSMYLPSRYQVG